MFRSVKTRHVSAVRRVLTGSVAVVALAAGSLISLGDGTVSLGGDAAFAQGNSNNSNAGGNGNGNGGGNGGGRGNGNGNGGGNAGGNGNGNGGGNGGPPPWANANGNGNGNGNDNAGGNGAGNGNGLARYADAIEEFGASNVGNGNGNGRGGYAGNVGNEVVGFSSDETNMLIANGWTPPGQRTDDNFPNHGQRVSTFVAIARELGLNPSVGAHQANWGTPDENGLGDLADALAEAKEAEDDDAIEELEAELAAATAGIKPGNGPQTDWALADLDVDGDGDVDEDDLAAARAGERPGNDPDEDKEDI